jgi:hypothetical protein
MKMAYNNGYPMNYQFYQPNYQFQQQPQIQQNMQIQNGGFISVPSEEVARNYPVAHGNSVTFKDENAPYVYTKTMGFSQLDRPIFEKYKLVREEDTPSTPSLPQEPSETSETDINMFNDIKGQVEEIRADLDDVKKRLEKVEDLGA